MVAEKRHTASLRLYRPGSIVAFGKRDAVSGGFDRAVAAAGSHGFDSVVRLAGGRAAVFHEETIAFALTIPTASPRDGIDERFQTVAALLATAFWTIGVPARVGELPGEYCPGEYSINAGGRKVMGIGQRLVSGAAHVGGVIVVNGGDRIARVLTPVYEALDLTWHPNTAGDLTSVAPGLRWADVRAAVLQAFGTTAEIRPAELPDEVLQRAADLESGHRTLRPH